MASQDSVASIRLIDGASDFEAALDTPGLNVFHFSRYRSVAVVEPHENDTFATENHILRCFSCELDHMATRRKKAHFWRVEYNVLSQQPSILCGPQLPPIFSPRAESSTINSLPHSSVLSHPTLATHSGTTPSPCYSPPMGYGNVDSGQKVPLSGDIGSSSAAVFLKNPSTIPRTPVVSMQEGQKGARNTQIKVCEPYLPSAALFDQFISPAQSPYGETFPCVILFENKREVMRFTPLSVRQMAIEYINGRAAAAALQAVVDEHNKIARNQKNFKDRQTIGNEIKNTNGPEIIINDGLSSEMSDKLADTRTVPQQLPNVPEGSEKYDTKKDDDMLKEKYRPQGIRFAGSFSATNSNVGLMGTEPQHKDPEFPPLSLPPNHQQLVLAGGSEDNATYLILLEDYIRTFKGTEQTEVQDTLFHSTRELEAAAIVAAESIPYLLHTAPSAIHNEANEDIPHPQAKKYRSASNQKVQPNKAEKKVSSSAFCC